MRIKYGYTQTQYEEGARNGYNFYITKTDSAWPLSHSETLCFRHWIGLTKAAYSYTLGGSTFNSYSFTGENTETQIK